MVFLLIKITKPDEPSMKNTIPQTNEKRKFHEEITAHMLIQIIGMKNIETVIEKCQVREQRKRKLPAAVTILLCIGMNIFTDLRMSHVLLRLASGWRQLTGEPVDRVAGDSAICAARYHLGAKPLQSLFQQVCQPIASPDTPGAFCYGLRLVALDGMRLDLADTAENDRYFGRPGGTDRSPWPQVDGVYLSECGTHVIFDVYFGPYGTSERRGAYRLLRSITAGMLVLWDNGFYSVDLILRVQKRGAHLLGRLPAYVKPEKVAVLPDGSYLAYLYPGDYQERKAGKRALVRVIEYTFDDPHRPGYGENHRLFTTLLDPDLYPAHELVCLYHERWEIEITFDEIETHQGWLDRPLRSRKPVGVIQELYSLLIAHFILRSLMHQAAETKQLDPDRLSFVHALRMITETLPLFLIADPVTQPVLFTNLLADLVHPRFLLPPRANRINPRVVKKRTASCPRKRLADYRFPQPTKPFQEAIVLCPSPP